MGKEFYSLESITNYRELGTGRQRRRIVAVNEEGRIIFHNAQVLHNCDSHGQIVFANFGSFNPRTEEMYTKFSRTLNSTSFSDLRKVSLKLSSEIWEHRWFQQCEEDKVDLLLKKGSSGDIIAFADLVAMVLGLPSTRHNPLQLAKAEIRNRLEFLGLPALRSLTALLDVKYGLDVLQREKPTSPIRLGVNRAIVAVEQTPSEGIGVNAEKATNFACPVGFTIRQSQVVHG